jgi:outer membrane protein assembly factor BamB
MAIDEIGVPVRSVNWVRLHAGANQQKQPCIYATMGQQGANLFVLQIDPDSGAFRQFMSPVAKSNYPTATLMSTSGRLYVGSAYAGHLLCFDPAEDALLDLGAIHEGAATFPCRIDEDADGRIWIGSYGTADLTCYDPDTDTLRPYGRMDDVDMYNYPFVNADGLIVNFVKMTRPHVVMLDPSTGEKKPVGPMVVKGEGDLNVVKATDGWVYVLSSEGNYRIEGMSAIAVTEVPEQETVLDLSDGSTFSFADAPQQLNRKLEVKTPGGETRLFDLDYEASGSDIFVLHEGPDQCVYGSSILPLHLFRYKPTDGELIDLGKCSESGGEAYSMANLNGKMYISSYPAARMSVYDTSQGYAYGTEEGANPRDIDRVDEVSYRPRSTLTGPLGRVWTASLPDYGIWGGPLSYYDPQTSRMGSCGPIYGDGSCYSLAHLEEQKLIAVGTSMQGGSGTQPRVDHACLILWDYEAEAIAWQGTLDRPVSVFNALTVGGDGLLYGTVLGRGEPELFVFDPVSHQFVDAVPILDGHPLDLGLQTVNDVVHGFTSQYFYRLDTDSLSVDVIFDSNDSITAAGPVVGNRVHFGCGCRLMRYAL